MRLIKELIVVAGFTLSCSLAHAGTVTLHNRVWRNGVTIDVRVGNNANCELNTAQGQRTVPYNGQTTISGGTQSVCYRRDQNPDNPTGRWGSWTVYSFDAVDNIN
jgi:hypothetical protein